MRRAAQAILALTLVATALALGGAHVRVVQLATSAVVLAGALAWFDSGFGRVAGSAWVFATLSAYSLVQTIPLPIALLTRLSPHAADIWSRSLRPLGEEVAFASLSLDPAASRIEAAKWGAYAVAFCMAAAFGRRRGASPVIAAVFGSSVVVALATAAHALIGASSVFGVYEPKFSHPGWRIGPFLNANCLAGFLLLGSLCGLGLAASDNWRKWRWGILVCVALMAGIIAVSGSRGGAFATLVGVLTFLLLQIRHERTSHDDGFTALEWAGIAVILVAMPALALIFAPDGWELLTQRDADKLRLWRTFLPIVNDFSWFGLGRGAFESVYQRYRPAGLDLVYTHPENIAFQWLSEWGTIAGTVGFLAFAWHLRPARLRLARHRAALGAMVGVAALVLQNLVDFGLELFAPMLGLSLVCGACVGQVRPLPQQNSERRRSWPALALLLYAAAAVATAWTCGERTNSFDRLALQGQYEVFSRSGDGSKRATELLPEIRAAIIRHPADAYLPRLGALVALRTGGNALPWITRALENCPVDSRTHWLLAEVLRRHGLLSQAMLEARLTTEYEPGLAPTVGTTVLTWASTVEDVERAAPLGALGGTVLYYAALSAKDRNARVGLLRAAARRDPNAPPLLRALAEELLAGLGTADCAGQGGYEDEIFTLAAKLEALLPRQAEGSAIRAQVLHRCGQIEQAQTLLKSRCPQFEGPQQSECWATLLTIVPATAENRDLTEQTARRMVAVACQAEEGCQQALLRAGDALAVRADWFGALGYYERAAGRAPTAQALVKVADAALALGQVPAAARALAMAANHARDDPPTLKQIEEKRRALSDPRL